MGTTMPRTPQSTASESAGDLPDTERPVTTRGLSALLVETLQANRRLQLELGLAQEQAAGRLEALLLAVDMLNAADKLLASARSACQAQREELRRYIAAQVADATRSRAA